MKRHRLFEKVCLSILCFAVWATAAPTPAAGKEASVVWDVATARPVVPGAPKKSDVVFSSRWLRKPNGKNDHDTFATARAFHATRMDWAYAKGNLDWIRRAREAGYTFGTTINTSLPDETGGRTYERGRMKRIDGVLTAPPRFIVWGPRYGCASAPEYRDICVNEAVVHLEAGADCVQKDDTRMNITGGHYGACFCEYCMKGFREFLKTNATPEQLRAFEIEGLDEFDFGKYLADRGTPGDAPSSKWKCDRALLNLYVAFQEENVLDFYRDIHARIEKEVGRDVCFSCNNAEAFIEMFHQTHDYGMFESYPDRDGIPPFFYRNRIRPSRELGAPFCFTFVSDDMVRTRRFIGMCYAMGATMIVPWDVYTGATTPRVFARPEDCADLYGFVRALTPWLEDHEEAAVTGAGLSETRYGERPPFWTLEGSGKVYGVMRARPGKPGTPVAIHLVEHGPRSEPFTLAVDPGRLFGVDTPVRARLLRPAPYDAAAHEAAETSKDYAALAVSRDLGEGALTSFAIPALDPWGVVIVEPAKGAVPSVWQPLIHVDREDYGREVLAVEVRSPSPGAAVRFTRDGSEPTMESEVCEGPIQLSDSATIRAKSFREGKSGPAASARFAVFEGSRPVVQPDAKELRDRLKLWLRADALAPALKDGDPVKAWSASAGPDAVWEPVTLVDGTEAGPPTFKSRGLNGRPVVSFDGVNDSIVVRDFSGQHLAGHGFTIFMVARSDDPMFGMSGNSAMGGGGIPRLYLSLGKFHYEALSPRVDIPSPSKQGAVVTFEHDGVETIRAFANGEAAASLSGRKPVDEFGGGGFGSGGHLAMPFWAANRNCAGDMAEIVVYDRPLTDEERRGVEEYLMRKYIYANWR